MEHILHQQERQRALLLLIHLFRLGNDELDGDEDEEEEEEEEEVKKRKMMK